MQGDLDSEPGAWYTMQNKILYHNQDGVRRTFLLDQDNPHGFTIHSEVEMDQVLESIKLDRENHKTGTTNKLVARVPLTVYEKSLVEQWDEGDWKKWLNDPDNAAFRVWQGRV